MARRHSIPRHVAVSIALSVVWGGALAQTPTVTMSGGTGADAGNGGSGAGNGTGGGEKSAKGCTCTSPCYEGVVASGNWCFIDESSCPTTIQVPFRDAHTGRGYDSCSPNATPTPYTVTAGRSLLPTPTLLFTLPTLSSASPSPSRATTSTTAPTSDPTLASSLSTAPSPPLSTPAIIAVAVAGGIALCALILGAVFLLRRKAVGAAAAGGSRDDKGRKGGMNERLLRRDDDFQPLTRHPTSPPTIQLDIPSPTLTHPRPLSPHHSMVSPIAPLPPPASVTSSLDIPDGRGGFGVGGGGTGSGALGGANGPGRAPARGWFTPGPRTSSKPPPAPAPVSRMFGFGLDRTSTRISRSQTPTLPLASPVSSSFDSPGRTDTLRSVDSGTLLTTGTVAYTFKPPGR
ncbi:hypothetical protein M427DRAFT_71987 [Gonapodya prolifera JEL478]|uniref:Uncharacterized protein n=1 Tax=Gonapodya prolifera (strain JEL478) TaxID=1344416 RepID=A0A139A7V5_GONPJ|nr:hypothetical protein M427DRAFT_71987 [Gonapodya prolifera JEL478]|eukprot:KXS12525.1 hypothetical protein M427DRAFT_71987 [Gonapodya prolifera JEL478]